MVTISTPQRVRAGGSVYVTVTVTETAIVAGAEWGPIEVPTIGTLTLVTATLVDGGNSSTRIAPELGTAANWPTTGPDHIAAVATPAALCRMQDNLRFVALNGQLFGRSKPNGAIAGEIVTRLTWMEGHQ